MEAHNHFTCIAYDTVDFLIPSKYVVSGIYSDLSIDKPNVMFNKETLPHMHIGNSLEKEFLCSSHETYKVILVMKKQDFSKDVLEKIVSLTDTAFPASGNLALSVNGSISSKVLDINTLHLMPGSIRARMWECGVCAMGFSDSNRKRILISPDLIMRKLFAAGMIKRPEKQGGQK